MSETENTQQTTQNIDRKLVNVEGLRTFYNKLKESGIGAEYATNEDIDEVCDTNDSNTESSDSIYYLDPENNGNITFCRTDKSATDNGLITYAENNFKIEDNTLKFEITYQDGSTTTLKGTPCNSYILSNDVYKAANLNFSIKFNLQSIISGDPNKASKIYLVLIPVENTNDPDDTYEYIKKGEDGKQYIEYKQAEFYRNNIIMYDITPDNGNENSINITYDMLRGDVLNFNQFATFITYRIGFRVCNINDNTGNDIAAEEEIIIKNIEINNAYRIDENGNDEQQ